MQHEKTINRDDGSKVKIKVFSPQGENNIWRYALLTKAKDENKFVGLPVAFADLVVSPAEILTAKLELWQKLKPQ